MSSALFDRRPVAVAPSEQRCELVLDNVLQDKQGFVPTHYLNGGSKVYKQHPDNTIIPFDLGVGSVKKAMGESIKKREARLGILAGDRVSKDGGAIQSII